MKLKHTKTKTKTNTLTNTNTNTNCFKNVSYQWDPYEAHDRAESNKIKKGQAGQPIQPKEPT